MFKRDYDQDQETVSVILDGEPRRLQAGVSVAAALLGDGQLISRISPSSGKACGPHCLMGVCYECLMEIDGVQKQSCVIEVKEGMKIKRNLSKHEGDL